MRVMSAILGLIVCAAGAAWAAEPVLPTLPACVSEVASPVQLQVAAQSANLTVARPAGAADACRISYSLTRTAKQASMELSLPRLDSPAERLRFWIAGDRSQHTLDVSVYHEPSQSWIALTSFPIDFESRRHIEVAAGSPWHALYPTFTKVRFTFARASDDQRVDGAATLSGVEVVRSELLRSPLPQAVKLPVIFDTWGGPSEAEIKSAAAAGVNLHLAPIGFPHGPSAQERVSYAVKCIPWMKASGMMVGIAFYAQPPEEWIKAHTELLCQKESGVAYTRAGGTFLSPWNPKARELWVAHIVDSLTELKKAGVLNQIDVVQLCPGEEGEVSFEWSHVWAHDSFAQAAYRDYLKSFYHQDIQSLNSDWSSSYSKFEDIVPPSEYGTDRAHWVFSEFYRYSMLRECIMMADAVQTVFTPPYFSWMTHTIGNPQQRFYSARYPLFYIEQLRRLNLLHIARYAALDWQSPEDVVQARSFGACVIGEADVTPTLDRMIWTFGQARKFHFDGLFVGVAEPLSSAGALTPLGLEVQKQIPQYREFLGR